MPSYYISNALGASVIEPSAEQMKTLLAAIDANDDEEHGAVWLSTDDGVTLEWSWDGRLVLGERNAPSRHLLGVTSERCFELWCALAAGKHDEIARCAWGRGSGFDASLEEAKVRAAVQEKDDRRLYDALDAERADVPCKEPGCTRGAIRFSVLCRPHHFESVAKRPCPFDHEPSATQASDDPPPSGPRERVASIELQLLPPTGQPLLEPNEVLARLRREFRFVETSHEEGAAGLRKLIRRWRRTSPKVLELGRDGKGRGVDRKSKLLDELRAAIPHACYVRFGDDAQHNVGQSMVPPGGFLIVAERDWQHVLARRCALALGYDIHEI